MHRRSLAPQHQSDPLILAACTWLASGIVLLGLTPLPLHDVVWGWSPAFWLLLAPAVVLCARSLSTHWTTIRNARFDHGARRQTTRRRDPGNGAYTPVRAHGGLRRRTKRRARQAV